MIYDSILGTIGRTPVVRIQRLAPKNVTMYVKCEFFNPLSSVKDRLAIAIIEDGERSGALKPGQTVVEATSGNTGIALAMVCAAKGYPFVALMADSFSIERRKIMRMLGAKLILTPAAERGSGMVKKAAELAKKHGWFLARQFENPANPAYHRNTTGAEILQRFCRQAAGLLRHRLGHRRHPHRRRRAAARGTPGDQGHRLRAGRGLACSRASPGHPTRFRAGPRTSCRRCSTGTSPEKVLPVTDAEAVETARKLSSSEGIFCGISSGATFAAALKVAAEAPAGSVILAMLPDTAERYLSTVLFEGIPEGGDPEP